MPTLDLLDIKLLRELQRNSEVNMKELSATLNISKTPIYQRIKKLEDGGFIKKYVALADQKKVGLPLTVFCHVSLAIHDEDNFNRFNEAIRSYPEVVECYTIDGIYDYILKVVTKDFEEYDRFVSERITRFQGISKVQSTFAMNEVKNTTELNIR